MESRQDRMELATDAGYPKVSLGSVLAGVLVAYGAFAVIAAIAGGILTALGIDMHELSSNNWREYGVATGAVAAFSLFLAYLFGGYVAGRMARRAGALNGALVFLLGILLVAGVAAAIGTQADHQTVVHNLRSMGVPTSTTEYSATLGTFAGVAGVVAMLLGSVLGGVLGERWHGKLLTRALDPAVGPAVVDADADDNATEVRSPGRHFATTSDDVDADAKRKDDTVDVTDRSTTLDDDLDPERTRTLH